MCSFTATLTQQRQGDREDREAIEEVFSKRPGRDGFVEAAMGGGDHADVDGNLAMIAIGEFANCSSWCQNHRDDLPKMVGLEGASECRC